MITIETVEKAWSNFDKYKETAEQHEFPKILLMDLKLQGYYDDLHKNWDEGHAEIFMRCMQKVARHFGFECPEF